MDRTQLIATLARLSSRFTRELVRARRGVPEGVHQARVAARRLREAVGALEPVLPPGTARKAVRRLRACRQNLGAVREADVTLTVLAREAAHRGWPTAAVAHVGAGLKQERADAQRALLRRLRGWHWRLDAGTLRAGLARAGDQAAWHAVLAEAARRRRRRAARLAADLEALSGVYVPDQLHAVRISAKKLRYALEWECDLGAHRWVRERQRLEQMQDLLGEWHDRLVLQERVNRVRRAGELPRVRAHELRSMALELEVECRAVHARMRAQAPAMLVLARRAAAR